MLKFYRQMLSINKKSNYGLSYISTSLYSENKAYKDGNAIFTTVPLKALSNQIGIRHQCL